MQPPPGSSPLPRTLLQIFPPPPVPALPTTPCKCVALCTSPPGAHLILWSSVPSTLKTRPVLGPCPNHPKVHSCPVPLPFLGISIFKVFHQTGSPCTYNQGAPKATRLGSEDMRFFSSAMGSPFNSKWFLLSGSVSLLCDVVGLYHRAL